jgi:hypothetical protein
MKSEVLAVVKMMLKIETVCFSEILLSTYEPTVCHNPEKYAVITGVAGKKWLCNFYVTIMEQ